MPLKLPAEPHLAPILEAGMQQMEVEYSSEQRDMLLAYLQLLMTWNKAYNLTAIRDPGEMIRLHLLDSLAVLPHISGKRLIDVGTGAGLPGIPLAIMCPERDFTLLDSNGKKTRFLFQARCDLGLSNLKEINSRVENHQPEVPYDAVLSRAFTSVADMVKKCSHLLSPEGLFLAMKGKFPQSELSEVGKDYKVDASHTLQVPGVDGERHLIVISRDVQCTSNTA
ncbi:16S rRNA (guanine(527)-N(7))-methyltransferase RsmG [Porticoccaceae bacterium]|nr:16S rRNA (guanine(527)-N(7))-methyltransferase RsmG [Porticoccaceae bacterium]MDC0011178.1 16S rRNA (guanine(527)-N(7))-methyltransferase RsmG [Porticoccaceae bacterium]MDC1453748.1 16S rRNA (guanine(527)-N(7))-methyltransferase RsmG [Porticoccaceae bacterium]